MRSTGIKLGAFTLVTIIVTFWLASIIGKLSPFQNTYEIEAVFTDATGVLNGDPVKIAGVPIGKVTGFKVEDGEAIVTMEINGDVEIPEDSFADIKFLNLLGQRVVNIKRDDDPAADPLEEGEQIPVTQTSPALDLSVVFNNLRPLIQSTNPEHINTVSRAVLAVFKGKEQDLAAILGNLGNLTSTLADRDQRLARLVTDLDALTQVLNRKSTSIRTGLRNFTEFMESLARITPRIERVVDQLEQASTKFGGVVSRNRGNLDQEIADLKILLDIINEELGPLDRIAKNLKEVLLATARSQSYGKWWNLYVVNFCPEAGKFGVNFPESLDCRR
ncbi:MAG: MCE family protein [Actinomycetota bacterium]|nr:MCE family protein [Actinomycetota bacterium]